MEDTLQKIELSKEKISLIGSQLISLQDQISELYEKRRRLINNAVEQKIPRILFKQNQDGTWTRVKIIDNAERLNDGYYEFTKVERFSVKVETLKNKPKELK